MFITKVLFYAVIFCYYDTVFASNETRCFDCVTVRSCQPALDIVLKKNRKSPEERQKLNDAFCGFYKKLPKVCCSNFTLVEGTATPATAPVRFGGSAEESSSSDDSKSLQPSTDYIESHRNLKLLPDTCGGIDGTRIIGGTTAKLYEFPWMALIAYNTRDGIQYNCAGSVINSRYVLTAGHCVMFRGVLRNIEYVRIGEWDSSTDLDCEDDYVYGKCESNLQDIPVENIIPHHGFNRSAPQDDIALLRLTLNVNFTYKNAEPICLPIYKYLRELNLSANIATAAGWGVTETGFGSDKLKKVGIPIWQSDRCGRKRHTDKDNEQLKIICAGGYLKDACQGDSGGPLILETAYEGSYRYVQYGIVSRGPRSCGTESPGIYTDVTKYMDWILDNIS